jgi:mono/diheme cytochrome c family protein
LALALPLFGCSQARSPEPATLGSAQQVVHKYCVACHSANGQASELNWGNEPTLILHRRNIAAKVRLNSMPPPGLPRPDANERRVLLCWALSNADGCAK